MLDEAFALRSSLSETEASVLYYIPGYVTKKKNIMSNNKDMESHVGIVPNLQHCYLVGA